MVPANRIDNAGREGPAFQHPGADFVRLKVFVGGAMTAQGPRHGLCAAAVAHPPPRLQSTVFASQNPRSVEVDPLAEDSHPNQVPGPAALNL